MMKLNVIVNGGKKIIYEEKENEPVTRKCEKRNGLQNQV
jgi:hypothetical protein